MEEEKKEIIEVENINNTEEKQEKKVEETIKKDKKGFCISALVLGIIALVFFCIWYVSIPCGILAIVFGIIGIKTPNKGMAIAGLITGSIGLAISVLIIITLFMFGFAIGITDAFDNIEDDFNRGYHRSYDLYD